VVSEYSTNSKTPPSQNPDLIPFFEHAPPAVAERAPSSRGRRSFSQRSHTSQSHSQV
jgi:Ca2+-transporting ATPase